MKQNLLKSIPSVDQISKNFASHKIRQDVLTTIIRDEVELLRKSILNGIFEGDKVKSQLINNISLRLKALREGSIQKVINSTGIILHTGLGRAPFPEDFFDEMKDAVSGYYNLEFDVKSGKRGERLDHVREYLRLLSRAENSVVVNNNAAALILILNTIALKKEVIVSRGELIEIGGSFRLPDVIEKSGAIIREIGTTNRTHLKDYEKAINKNTAAILIAHTSNYKINGFTKSPDYKDIINFGKQHNIPVILDQGSGDFNLGESNIKDLIRLGFDVVCFSGDKLLGGPQSGIILGKEDSIQQILSNPFYRAFRCDKFTIFALEWTLSKIVFGQGDLIEKNKLLARNQSELKSIGKYILSEIENNIIEKYKIEISETSVEFGSGSLPTKNIDSIGLVFHQCNAEKLSKSFRSCDVPVIGYISKDKFIIDLKAISKEDAEILKIQMYKVLV